MGVIRCAGFLDALDKTTDGQKQAAAQTQVAIVDALYGTDEWRSIVRDTTQTALQREDKLVALYCDRILPFRKYVISRRLPTRSDLGGTMFHLVFATDNETGLEKFNDAAFQVLRKAFQTKPSTDVLQGLLTARYKGKVVEWGEIILDYGSRYKTSWVRNSLKRLVEAGSIRESQLLTRKDRRNPEYDFTMLGGPPAFGAHPNYSAKNAPTAALN